MQGGTLVQGDLIVGGSAVPAMESVPAAPKLSRLPAGSELFVGRAGELERLDRVAADSGRAVVVAVHGLGGVGKSALAGRFAHLHADRFTLVWWITADTVSALDAGLADLAGTLAPHVAALPSEQRTDLGVQWLATHEGWLLVLDNLTGPGDAARLLERVRTGTVVITSRQGGGWRGVEAIQLDVLSPAEAAELLTRVVRGEWPEADLADADRLCEELGWLPLAVEQVGAYLAQTRITPVAYLDLLARFPAQMFTATAEGGDAQRTMARVWHLTLDRLADTPLAGHLLRQLAWYASDAIPRALVAAGVNAPEPDVVQALGRLAAYSMITLDADTISVHRLVQAVTRIDDLSDPYRRPDDIAHARDTTTAILVRTLTEVDPGLPAAWPVFRTLLPHARALLEHTHPDTDTALLCALADHLGRYLENQGDPATAITLHTRAAQGHERLHSPDHPNTLASRNNLAGAYETAGDLGRAIPLYEASLVD
ncbi:tetratricopeptide repeat protein, partial [Saccharothrix sp. NRRL B-16348]|uniref:tetratricopeptide repeat protein n=1 Tax=Saccharothrix sp. NRRL B-16348 TaxID=1415542 RepID=UPI000AC4993F